MSWTGERLNDMLSASHSNRPGPVGFIDMSIGQPYRETYTKMWDQSRENAKCMRKHLGVTANLAARSNVGFTVSTETAKRIRAAIAK